MNTTKKRIQHGMLASEILWVVLVFTALALITVRYQSYQKGHSEISAQQYQTLASAASESCSGGNYLKDRVSTGPIKNIDFPEVLNDLTSRAQMQGSETARTNIAGTTAKCL